jgi:hypothetical protein
MSCILNFENESSLDNMSHSKFDVVRKLDNDNLIQYTNTIDKKNPFAINILNLNNYDTDQNIKKSENREKIHSKFGIIVSGKNVNSNNFVFNNDNNSNYKTQDKEIHNPIDTEKNNCDLFPSFYYDQNKNLNSSRLQEKINISKRLFNPDIKECNYAKNLKRFRAQISEYKNKDKNDNEFKIMNFDQLDDYLEKEKKNEARKSTSKSKKSSSETNNAIDLNLKSSKDKNNKSIKNVSCGCTIF